ncbi:MAG: hypothetical protein IPM38_04345 [Ignavibacteria bacterium]|nr:hypothetical protein [Ignavibacteria bacterium]
MNRPLIIKFLSGLINIVTCLVTVIIVLYLQDWFGKGDTYAFILWTVPLAAGLSVSGQTILNIFRTHPFLLKLFFIILTAGICSFIWVYCLAFIFGPWIGAYSFPILYLWIIGSILQLLFLDWRLPKRTDKQKISKTIIILLSFPLTIIVVIIGMYLYFFASSYLTRPEKETYLIPEGYIGTVLVIFNQSDGEKPEYEDGRRIYRIPPSGVLFTQLKDEQGILNQEYFYISPNGQRLKLGALHTRDFNEESTILKNTNEPPRDSLAVFNPDKGKIWRFRQHERQSVFKTICRDI